MVSVSDFKSSPNGLEEQSSPTSNPKASPATEGGAGHPVGSGILTSDRNIYQGSIQPRGFPPFPENWVSEWETFPSTDGKLQLYSVIHHPQEWSGPRVLAVFHGIGEHGGRYLHFSHFMKSSIDAIYSMDHRGHGRSEGVRGHVDKFDLFADDVALALSRLDEHLKKRFGRSEIHVLGHSLGGLIVLRTLFKYSHLPIFSATLSAPVLGLRVEVPIVKKGAALCVSRLWGTLQLASELDPQVLSRDPDVVEAYTTDRLVHNKVSARLYTEMLSAIGDTVKRDSGLQYPLQILVPLKDDVVDPEAQLSFFRQLKLRDKLLKTYPDFRHEIFNDIGKEQIFGDLISWITKHQPN